MDILINWLAKFKHDKKSDGADPITDEQQQEIIIPEREVLIPRELFMPLDEKSFNDLKKLEKDNPPEYIMRVCYLMSVESLHGMRKQTELLEDILKELRAMRSSQGQRIKPKSLPKSEWELSLSN